ncbi:hypothetical protein CTI14_64560, partial [Methylobacterium radiotolerans]
CISPLQALHDVVAAVPEGYPVMVDGGFRRGADDARMAHGGGADGVIVSNHGGRQLDGCISPLQALHDVVAAVPEGYPVMVDGGFRRGAD